MNRRSQNLQAMHEAVIKAFDDHPVQTSFIPLLATKVAEMKNLSASIKTLETERSKLKTGVADAKKSAKTALSATAYAISRSLYIFARMRGDEELAGAMNFTVTEFRRFSDADLETKSKVVLDKLKELLPLLGELNLQQMDVDDLENKFERYVSKKTMPRNHSNLRKDLTGRMRLLFVQMQELLQTCDLLMLRLKQSEPQFWNIYTAARVIVDRGGSQSAAPAESPSGKMAATPPPALAVPGYVGNGAPALAE